MVGTIERNIEIPFFWIQTEEPLPENVLKRVKKNAEETADKQDALLWSQEAGMSMNVDELYYENGKVFLSASTSGACVSLEIPLTKGMMVDIIEAHMKKLGQLKTLLELANKIDKEGD